MDAQKPTVGRIVHYYPGGELGKKKGQPFAAVITHVWGNDCVNLEIMEDGSFPAWPSEDVATCYPTSVMRSDEPRARHWCWPPRA
ncbi:MAG: hypothetical protein JNG88_16170 [Phycisphaerales bacterium]|nr:hypothetical protein [Phycisphaerales bacterium]